MRATLAVVISWLALGALPALAQDIQPGRGSGSFVEVDPIASPLASAAQATADTCIDGLADGSGVTDAAAFRAAIAAPGGTTGGSDNRVLRSDGTGGATLQSSSLVCDDDGNVSGLASVAIGGTTASSSMLYSDGGAATNRWRMDADAGVARILSWATGDVARWAIRVGGAESGANTGGDIALRRYDDAGAFVSAVWSAVRSTGALTIPNVAITGGSVTGITDLAIADGGTGASTASDARTNLGLGTAAVESAASFQAADATLTAFAGATCSASTLLYCSGSDTVSAATITSAGLALLDDADASAQRTTLGLGTAATTAATDYAAAWPADSWGYSWVTADGNPTSLGWSQVGTQTLTVASTTYLGESCYSLTPSGSSGTALIAKASGVVATGSWELRMRVAYPASVSTTARYCWWYCPDTTASGSKRFEFGVNTTGLTYWNATTTTQLATVGDMTAQWVDVTYRANKNATNGIAEYYVETWVGATRVGGQTFAALGATSVSAGDIILGRSNTGTNASVMYVSAIRVRSGLNETLPSVRFMASTWPQ